MKKSFNISSTLFLLLAFAVMLLSGCRRDELCFLHPSDALIELKIDWSRSALSPNSASAIIYKDGRYYRTEVFSVYPPVRKVVDLPVGHYSIVTINEQLSDFEKYVHWGGMEQWNTFETKVLDDTQYDRGLTRSLKLEVDTMTADRIAEFDVTEDMIYRAHIHPTSKEDAANFNEVAYSVTFVPRRVFTAVSITLNVRNGASYYFALRNPPILSGMAESYLPALDQYSTNAVSHAISFSQDTRNSGSKMQYSKEHYW